SAAKQARRLCTVKWCISAVNDASGWLRARRAIRSIPVVTVAPPLGVDGVTIARAPICAPLCSAGGLDQGIGHFMLFEVDSEARAPVLPSPISPRTARAASGRRSAPLPSSHPAG